MTTSQEAASSAGEAEPRRDIDFDHHSAYFREHNYEIYDDLRSRCPVAHASSHDGFWVLTGYQAVDDATRNDELFNSYPAVAVPGSANPYPILPIESDPPLTQKLRSITLGPFSPKSAERLEPTMRQIATEQIDGFIEQGECDIVQQLTTPLPARLILHMQGLDESRWPEWVRWVHGSVHDRDKDPDGAAEAGMNMFNEIGAEMARRREQGLGDDLLSAIMQGTVDGEPLDEPSMIMYAFLMMLGGMDTTSGLTGNALVRLAEREDLRQRLIEDRSVLPAATEEFLRHDTPTQGLGRTVTRDEVFHGQQLRAGDRAILMWAAANRDPDVFGEDANEIDFDRPNKRHMAFGVGMHRCLGSNIARKMFQVMLDEILTRLPDFRISGDVARFADAGEVYAVYKLPITFTPGPKVGSR